MVVIGRSKIVGTPVAELLKWHNATVTLCHSQTRDLSLITQQADILIVAVGKTEVRPLHNYQIILFDAIILHAVE